MTSFGDHFSVIDEAIGPQEWMQLRLVATEQVPSVAKSYDTVGGSNKSDLMQELVGSWTNDSPIAQNVYGLVTKGGSQVTLQARSRGYLSMGHAVDFVTGAGDPAFDLVEVSKTGVGSDLGKSGLLALGGAFGMSELRSNSVTMPFMPHLTGWWTVAPGETIHAAIQVYFVSEFWENTILDGGDSDTQSMVIAGEIRLDLFALPVPGEVPVASTPTLVGSVTHDTEIDLIVADTQTSVTKPSGLVAGDTLLAVVCNQWGFSAEMSPVESGWTRIHHRDAGWGNVHMHIYHRIITGSEPATFKFDNAPLAEETAMLIGIRNAQPYDPVLHNWHIASNLSSWKFVEDQVAPSINRRGQLLIAVSYFSHLTLQAPITQTPPTGMVERADVPGAASTLSVATLSNPPRPTEDRRFTPSKIPSFTGHSITAAILIPGVIT